MNYCPDCNQFTSGFCPRHQAQIIKFSFYKSEVQTCVACGQPGEFMTQLPYGSRYDSDHLCAECIRQFADPKIDEMVARRIQSTQQTE